MRVDLLLSPFGRAVDELVATARVADGSDVRTVWVPDHFSGAMFGAPFTRHPFVCLGAMAAVTERVELGVLVANMVNRHPAQLASAVNSLQSLAPGRIRLGVGSGAAPASRFAAEHEMIDRTLLPAGRRRAVLGEYVRALRSVWRHDEAFTSESIEMHDLAGVVDEAGAPPIVVGASSWPTIEIALGDADGVNLRRTRWLPDQLERLAASRPDRSFEVSVLDNDVDLLDSSRQRVDGPWSASSLRRAGVDVRIVATPPVVDADDLQRLVTAALQ